MGIQDKINAKLQGQSGTTGTQYYLDVENSRNVALQSDLENTENALLKRYKFSLERGRKGLLEEITELFEEDGVLPSFDVEVELVIGQNQSDAIDTPDNFDEMVNAGISMLKTAAQSIGLVDEDESEETEFLPAYQRVYVVSQFVNANDEQIRYLVNIEFLNAGQRAKWMPYYRGMLSQGIQQEVHNGHTTCKVITANGSSTERCKRVGAKAKVA